VKVLRGPHQAWDLGLDGTAVTLGVFDGVHRGHAALLGLLAAESGGDPVGVVSFAVHPVHVLAPQVDLRLLTTLDQRLELLDAAGVSVVGLLDFDDALRRIEAPRFVEDVVAGAMRARLVVVGTDFRFGHERRGDIAMLATMGRRLGFRTVGIEPVASGGTISSTRIRDLVTAGAVGRATALLGRPHAVRGVVVEGDRRGRTIGFPTANLAVDPEVALPANGVYAVRVDWLGDRFEGVSNVGVRPTFGGLVVVVETHLLDFDGDLYGETLDVSFIERIRDEQRFDGVDALVGQIRRDVARARSLLVG
jgi:riboflavin kinase/FMN adenylyltransferase